MLFGSVLSTTICWPTSGRQSSWRGSVVHEPLHHVIVNISKERTDHVLDLVESLGTEEHRLVVRDVVVLNAHSPDVQRPQLRPFDLLNLPVRGEQTGAVRPDLVVFAYHTELQREPKDLRDELQGFSGLNAPSCLPGHSIERCETIISQAITVADDLMDDVGLWRVERHRVMANVLRGVENAVGQGSVELKERYQAGRRHVLEAGKRPQHLVHLNELRDVVFRKAQSLLAFQVRGTGQALMQAVQFGADDAPDFLLGVGVGRDGWWCAALPIHG